MVEPELAGRMGNPTGRRPIIQEQAVRLRRSEMVLYVILAVIFIVLLFAYVRVRGRRIQG
jgi:cell division protein FtsL